MYGVWTRTPHKLTLKTMLLCILYGYTTTHNEKALLMSLRFLYNNEHYIQLDQKQLIGYCV